jgi:ATP-binding cassette subfamily B protein
LISKVSGSTGIDFEYIGYILLLLVGLYLISTIFSIIQGFVMSGVAQKVSYNLRKSISEKMNKLPLSYFDKKTHGDVLSRVTNDVDTIGQTLNQSLSQIVTSITTIIGVIVMMLTISFTMTIITVLIVPFSGLLISFIVNKSQKYFSEYQELLGKMNGHVEEIYAGHNIVKAFNGEERAIEKFDNINEKLYNASWKSQFLSGMMMPVMTFIGNVGYVLVSILGGWFVIQGKIKVGDILAFVQYVRSFMHPVSEIAQVANVLQSTAAASERVFEFLEETEESKTEDVIDITAKDIKGNVEFRNVRFGYNEDRTIINNFCANIKKGQRIAIVGPTGAGKTTIVKLLMRFYELNGGAIYIDGKNIKNIKRSKLRKLIGMVLQDTWVFNGTIMENIRYGNLNATDEEVIEAAKLANVDHFVSTLPDGYNMVINEESSNISLGQKQLMTIARAILADPKILILDEATSSVDTRTEVHIQESMERLMQGRTSFIIAHRLSTIKNADLILVMNNGDIVEQGTHDELLKANGFYASLYKSQFETQILGE